MTHWFIISLPRLIHSCFALLWMYRASAEKLQILIGSVEVFDFFFQVLGHKWRVSLLVDHQGSHCGIHWGKIMHDDIHKWTDGLTHSYFHVCFLPNQVNFLLFMNIIRILVQKLNPRLIQFNNSAQYRYIPAENTNPEGRWVGVFSSFSTGDERQVRMGDCGIVGLIMWLKLYKTLNIFWVLYINFSKCIKSI